MTRISMQAIVEKVIKDNQKVLLESDNIESYKLLLTSLLESNFGKENRYREYKNAIFISHKTTQKIYAERLNKILDEMNYDVYLDTEDVGLRNLFKNISNDILDTDNFQTLLESISNNEISDTDNFQTLLESISNNEILDTDGLQTLFESISNDTIMVFLAYGIKDSDSFFCILSNDVENNSEYGAYDSNNWIEDEYKYASSPEQNKDIKGLRLDNYKEDAPFFWKKEDYEHITSFSKLIKNYRKIIRMGERRDTL